MSRSAQTLTWAEPKESVGSFESSIVAVLSIASACISLAWSEIVKNSCVKKGTCSAIESNRNRNGYPAWAHTTWLSANFVNVLFIGSISVLTTSNSSRGDLSALTQGYCGVGERLQRSALTNQPTCMTHRTFPNALDSSIMNPDGVSDHERACGKWLGAGVSLGEVEYLAFTDDVERAAVVQNAEAAQHAGARLSSSNLGKFRAACNRALLGGSAALRAAGVLAYKHLVAEAAIGAATDEASVLAATGMLTSFYCDGPVLFGWELTQTGLVTSVGRGVPFMASNILASALALVGASSALQAEAELANSHVNEWAWKSPAATIDQMQAVLAGGTGRGREASGEGPVGQVGMIIATSNAPELDGLIHLSNANATRARAYLHGVAALCAFSLEGIVDQPGYTAGEAGAAGATGAAAEWLRSANAQRPKASAIGHLEPPEGAQPMWETDEGAELNASMITLSQLVGATDGDDACLRFTRLMFPDEIDEINFETIVTPVLYARMESVVAQVRAGVAAVLRTNAAVRAALVDPDAVALDVEATRVRVPGAPRGSWAGSSRAMPIAALESDDGVFVMAARQARTLWLDRHILTQDASHPCEAPSAFNPLASNAYVHPRYRCSYFLLGMAGAPFADEMYDDESLVSRFGYIVAHELAHLSLNSPYQEAGKAALLARYPCDSSHDEAWADLLGVLGVLETGIVNSSSSEANSQRVCEHISQIWCARTQLWYDETGCSSESHPKANVRGDRLCQTLRDIGDLGSAQVNNPNRAGLRPAGRGSAPPKPKP